MKMLSQTTIATIKRVRRKCVVDDIGELMTLYEDEMTIEITIPSFIKGFFGNIKRAAKAGLDTLVYAFWMPAACPV